MNQTKSFTVVVLIFFVLLGLWIMPRSNHSKELKTVDLPKRMDESRLKTNWEIIDNAMDMICMDTARKHWQEFVVKNGGKINDNNQITAPTDVLEEANDKLNAEDLKCVISKLSPFSS